MLVIRGQLPGLGRISDSNPLPRVSVFAFCGRNKTLLAFIVALFVAEIAAQFAIIAVTAPSMDIIPSSLPSTLDASACLMLNIPSLFPSLWYGQSPWKMSIDLTSHLISKVPSLIFESFLFILVVVQFIRTRMEEGISSTPLLVVFVRDGTWAFMLIFGER